VRIIGCYVFVFIDLSSFVIIERLLADQSLSVPVVHFYFDFRKDQNQTVLALLSSLVFQLSTRSPALNQILLATRKKYSSALAPTSTILSHCLESLLRACNGAFIIIDAIDECHELGLHQELFSALQSILRLEINNIRILVTSRNEPEIRAVMEPLATHQIFLQDIQGHHADLSSYIRHCLSEPFYYSWPEEVKRHAESFLISRASGM